ncbi:MAG TPA: PadR family transcriptional regulator [Gemmatimonadales bacterium]|jgi:DNA-binding PadR family transcriptional regulator|nr:PadR family transcriptional regulator [Gemmatimonadales bacterium]
MAKRLAGLEELVLLAAASLGEQAYGVTVQQRLDAETGSAVSLGAVYDILGRLERKGYVRSAWGEATPQRGGRRKRMFRVTAPGLAALREMGRIRSRLSLLAPTPRPA